MITGKHRPFITNPAGSGAAAAEAGPARHARHGRLSVQRGVRQALTTSLARIGGGPRFPGTNERREGYICTINYRKVRVALTYCVVSAVFAGDCAHVPRPHCQLTPHCLARAALAHLDRSDSPSRSEAMNASQFCEGAESARHTGRVERQPPLTKPRTSARREPAALRCADERLGGIDESDNASCSSEESLTVVCSSLGDLDGPVADEPDATGRTAANLTAAHAVGSVESRATLPLRAHLKSTAWTQGPNSRSLLSRMIGARASSASALQARLAGTPGGLIEESERGRSNSPEAWVVDEKSLMERECTNLRGNSVNVANQGPRRGRTAVSFRSRHPVSPSRRGSRRQRSLRVAAAAAASDTPAWHFSRDSPTARGLHAAGSPTSMLSDGAISPVCVGRFGGDAPIQSAWSAPDCSLDARPPATTGGDRSKPVKRPWAAVDGRSCSCCVTSLGMLGVLVVPLVAACAYVWTLPAGVTWLQQTAVVAAAATAVVVFARSWYRVGWSWHSVHTVALTIGVAMIVSVASCLLGHTNMAAVAASNATAAGTTGGLKASNVCQTFHYGTSLGGFCEVNDRSGRLSPTFGLDSLGEADDYLRRMQQIMKMAFTNVGLARGLQIRDEALNVCVDNVVSPLLCDLVVQPCSGACEPVKPCRARCLDVREHCAFLHEGDIGFEALLQHVYGLSSSGIVNDATELIQSFALCDDSEHWADEPSCAAASADGRATASDGCAGEASGFRSSTTSTPQQGSGVRLQRRSASAICAAAVFVTWMMCLTVLRASAREQRRKVTPSLVSMPSDTSVDFDASNTQGSLRIVTASLAHQVRGAAGPPGRLPKPVKRPPVVGRPRRYVHPGATSEMIHAILESRHAMSGAIPEATSVEEADSEDEVLSSTEAAAAENVDAAGVRPLPRFVASVKTLFYNSRGADASHSPETDCTPDTEGERARDIATRQRSESGNAELWLDQPQALVNPSLWHVLSGRNAVVSLAMAASGLWLLRTGLAAELEGHWQAAFLMNGIAVSLLASSLSSCFGWRGLYADGVVRAGVGGHSRVACDTMWPSSLRALVLTARKRASSACSLIQDGGVCFRERLLVSQAVEVAVQLLCLFSRLENTGSSEVAFVLVLATLTLAGGVVLASLSTSSKASAIAGSFALLCDLAFFGYVATTLSVGRTDVDVVQSIGVAVPAVFLIIGLNEKNQSMIDTRAASDVEEASQIRSFGAGESVALDMSVPPVRTHRCGIPWRQSLKCFCSFYTLVVLLVAVPLSTVIVSRILIVDKSCAAKVGPLWGGVRSCNTPFLDGGVSIDFSCRLDTVYQLDLRGVDIVEIGTDVLQFPNLREIDARSNQHLLRLGPSVTQLPHLRSLLLQNTAAEVTVSWQSAGLSVYPKILHSLHGLEVLDLSGNSIQHLDDDDVCAMPHLRSLNLSRNELVSVPSGLIQSEQLEELDVANNRISSLDGAFTAVASRLRVLDVSGNNLSSLPPVLGSHEMEALHLSGNNITELNWAAQGIRFVPEAVTQLPLRTLVVSWNGIEALPRGLDKLREVETIDFSGNFVSNIPSSIAALPKLSTVIAHTNMLSEPPRAAHMFEAPQLRVVDVSCNFLRELPPSAWQAPLLRQLELGFNPIDAGGLSRHASRRIRLTPIEELNLEHTLIDSVPLVLLGPLPSLHLQVLFPAAVNTTGFVSGPSRDQSVGCTVERADDGLQWVQCSTSDADFPPQWPRLDVRRTCLRVHPLLRSELHLL